MLPRSACLEACFCNKKAFGPAVCWPQSSLCFWLQLYMHRTGWANVTDPAEHPLPLLASSSLSHCLTTNISVRLVFQKGKYISLVLPLYCKPSLDLQSVYLSINLAFKSSQPLWESYHSWRYFPFKAASPSSEEEIWDSKFF